MISVNKDRSHASKKLLRMPFQRGKLSSQSSLIVRLIELIPQQLALSFPVKFPSSMMEKIDIPLLLCSTESPMMITESKLTNEMPTVWSTHKRCKSTRELKEKRRENQIDELTDKRNLAY